MECQTVAYTRLRGEMNSTGNTFDSGLDIAKNRTIGQIELIKAEIIPFFQPVEARVLERHAIVVVHHIDADDFIAAIKKATCCMIADKAGCSGYKRFH